MFSSTDYCWLPVSSTTVFSSTTYCWLPVLHSELYDFCSQCLVQLTTADYRYHPQLCLVQLTTADYRYYIVSCMTSVELVIWTKPKLNTDNSLVSCMTSVVNLHSKLHNYARRWLVRVSARVSTLNLLCIPLKPSYAKGRWLVRMSGRIGKTSIGRLWGGAITRFLCIFSTQISISVFTTWRSKDPCKNEAQVVRQESCGEVKDISLVSSS